MLIGLAFLFFSLCNRRFVFAYRRTGDLSQNRFICAADGLDTFDHADSAAVEDFAFGLLDRVAYRYPPIHLDPVAC